jgi:hypothetical protein
MRHDLLGLLRMVCNLKLMNCVFLDFLFNVFRPQKLQKVKP